MLPFCYLADTVTYDPDTSSEQFSPRTTPRPLLAHPLFPVSEYHPASTSFSLRLRPFLRVPRYLPHQHTQATQALFTVTYHTPTIPQTLLTPQPNPPESPLTLRIHNLSRSYTLPSQSSSHPRVYPLPRVHFHPKNDTHVRDRPPCATYPP